MYHEYGPETEQCHLHSLIIEKWKEDSKLILCFCRIYSESLQFLFPVEELTVMMLIMYMQYEADGATFMGEFCIMLSATFAQS